ncbi:MULTISPECIES: hypothetical protein [Paenibacillus]|uniref:hypothetical protein n=1 Tax=Paenibacillus TaxID=44249 RepID=UPI0022B8F879|nr:hypothetical protein [Paenibacillus caseinilyticus]MCZ8518534.1 hypothetical protein [Paenibacillus caseinilyticus]
MKYLAGGLLCVLVLALMVSRGTAFFYSQPPLPDVMAGEQEIPVIRGSYCWSALRGTECVDIDSPTERMSDNGYVTMTAPARAKVRIRFWNRPSSTVLSVSPGKYGPGRAEVPGYEDFTFALPDAAGIYLYDLHAVWGEGNSSEYHFAVEVQGPGKTDAAQ